MKFRIDVQEGEPLPEKWISWGRILPYGRVAPVGKYFQLRFPFYQYKKDVWTRAMCWHQLCFLELRFPNVNERYIFGYSPIRNP